MKQPDTCFNLRGEFKLRNFGLAHSPASDFCKSEWQKGEKSLLWVIYRWALAVCFSVGVIGSLSQNFNAGKWFIYLTDWGFTLCMVTSIFGAILATIYYCDTTKFAYENRFVKFYWMTYTTTLLLALNITSIYWIFIHRTVDTSATELYNLWAHGFNSILMLLDFMIVAFPFRLLHLIYPIIAGTLYGCFSLVYFFAGGVDPFGNRFIYTILNWENPGLATISTVGTLALVFVYHIIFFGLYKIRKAIKSAVSGTSSFDL